MLSDGAEHPCETIDVSTTGFAVNAYVVADLGERVIAYVDEIGRLEGVVARRGDGWFAVEAKVTGSRVERLAQKLGELSGDPGAFSERDQASEDKRQSVLRTEFGQEFEVTLSEETRFGARVHADIRLLTGARVVLQGRNGVVIRETTDGFVVSFDTRVR